MTIYKTYWRKKISFELGFNENPIIILMTKICILSEFLLCLPELFVALIKGIMVAIYICNNVMKCSALIAL